MQNGKTRARTVIEKISLAAMFFALLSLFFVWLGITASGRDISSPQITAAGNAAPGAGVSNPADDNLSDFWADEADKPDNWNSLRDYPAPEITASPLYDLIGVNDIVYEPVMEPAAARESIQTDAATEADMEKLNNFEYLRAEFYIIEAETGLLPSDVDADEFLSLSFHLRERDGLGGDSEGPRVLIFHTHSNEMYADSNPGDPMDGVMGAGKALAEILFSRYGIETMHHTGRYDIVNGKSQIPGAYERMAPAVEEILSENPSIELVIDMHRDGLREGVPPLIAEIEGKRAAQVMFVNGLCRARSGGVLSPVSGLENPYIRHNMALSFQLQLTANRLYPGFARKVYLKPYRYSLNMTPKSILVEVGAQNNTKQEALNAMPPLAEIIARVVKP